MIVGARVVRLCLGAFAVCVAALLAHATIDLLGDVFLTRDAYDAVPHQSRAVAVIGAVLLLAPVASRLILATLKALAGEGASLTSLLRRSLPRSRSGFIVAVTVCAFPVLVGMEALDVLSSGTKIDDFGDLLAGAPLFSIGILAAVAAAVGLAVYQAFAWLISSTDAILAALAAFFCGRRAAARSAGFSVGTRARGCGSVAPLARHAGLRAPPQRLLCRH